MSKQGYKITIKNAISSITKSISNKMPSCGNLSNATPQVGKLNPQ